MRVWQINLQQHLGGGEVYTAALSRALARCGVASTLAIHGKARYWPALALPPQTEVVPVERPEALMAFMARLPRERAWLLGHGPLPAILASDARHFRTAVAHMPPQGRDPGAFDRHDLVLPVSAWVQAGLQAQGVRTWAEPMYGVAEARGNPGAALRSGNVYDFDMRKLRDRAMAWFYPSLQALRPAPVYGRRAGLTLGIVSRLTPIKQFPVMFGILAPVLAARAGVNLEIFGAGGYASVRDLKRALRPLAGRARFWGQQADVAAAYGGLDYLLTGLPEKEALGLNVIEAQSCGLPTLAVDAPPFTETVLDGATGWLYKDPRRDGGADFGRLLDNLLAGKPRPDPRRAEEHMRRFSYDALCGRVERLLAAVRAELA